MTGVPDAFAALANPTRREILVALRAGPAPVRDIAARFAMARPSVSEHLKVLRDAGLVGEQRRGRERLYRLEPDALAEVHDWLAPFEAGWRDRLGALRDALDDLGPAADRPLEHP